MTEPISVGSQVRLLAPSWSGHTGKVVRVSDRDWSGLIPGPGPWVVVKVDGYIGRPCMFSANELEVV